MVSKRTLTVLAVTATLVAVAAGAALAASDGSTPGSDNKTISVAGTGEVDAEPDAAVVRLSVRATADDAANASSQLAAGSERLRSTLAAFGVPAENVQTRGYYVREDPETRDRPDDDVRYVGEHGFEVTLDDVDRVGALVDAAVDGGADDVGGVSYTLSEDRREQIRDDAVRDAIANARSDAAVVADATDLETTGVAAASTQQASVRPYRAEAQALASGDAGTDVDVRDVTVSATVDVTFSATDG